MIETRIDQCQICVMKCGLAVDVDARANRVVRIRPDRENAAWHDFCQLAANSPRMIEHPRRLRGPMKRVGDRYVAATYEEAVAEIAAQLKPLLECDPDAIGLYLGNPGGLATLISAYAFGFVGSTGSRNRYLVTSLDNNSFYAVNQAMFGSAWFCLIGDIDASDCLILVGTNPAISSMNWMDVNIDGWKRVLRRVEAGAELIVVDPRLTETAQKATLHVAPVPGTDWAFLLGVIKVIFAEELEDRAACAGLSNCERLRALAEDAEVGRLAEISGVPEERIVEVARRFGRAPRGHVHTRTGVGQGRNGVPGEWLGQALNAITGRFDKPGGRYVQHGSVNLTEVAERRFPASDLTSRVRGLRQVVGARAVSELADEITTPGKGQLKALFIVGGNPVNAGPDGDALDSALAGLDLLVAVDLFQRESHRHAHWLIPGTHFLEREEFSSMVIATRDVMSVQYTAPSVAPPEGVRPESEFFTMLAAALDLPLFGQPAGEVGPREVFAGSLAGSGIDFAEVLRHPHGLVVPSERLGHFADGLRTPDHRIDVAPAAFVAAVDSLLLAHEDTATTTHPLRLISRRRRDMMNSSLLEQVVKRPAELGRTVELNPDDAAALGLASGDRVVVASETGAVEAIARLSPALRRGVASMEHGFGSALYDPAGGGAPESVGVSRNRLVSNRDLDPLSAMPRFNDTPVRVTRRL